MRVNLIGVDFVEIDFVGGHMKKIIVVHNNYAI